MQKLCCYYFITLITSVFFLFQDFILNLNIVDIFFVCIRGEQRSLDIICKFMMKNKPDYLLSIDVIRENIHSAFLKIRVLSYNERSCLENVNKLLQIANKIAVKEAEITLLPPEKESEKICFTMALFFLCFAILIYFIIYILFYENKSSMRDIVYVIISTSLTAFTIYLLFRFSIVDFHHMFFSRGIFSLKRSILCTIIIYLIDNTVCKFVMSRLEKGIKS